MPPKKKEAEKVAAVVVRAGRRRCRDNERENIFAASEKRLFSRCWPLILSIQWQGFQQVEVCASDPRTVVLMLNSPEQAIVCRACEALHKHMENGRHSEL